MLRRKKWGRTGELLLRRQPMEDGGVVGEGRWVEGVGGKGGSAGGEKRRRDKDQMRHAGRRSERDAISSPHLAIMSLYFKVQSVPVMLLHNGASGGSPLRSADKKKKIAHRASRSVARSLCDTFQV